MLVDSTITTGWSVANVKIYVMTTSSSFTPAQNKEKQKT